MLIRCCWLYSIYSSWRYFAKRCYKDVVSVTVNSISVLWVPNQDLCQWSRVGKCRLIIVKRVRRSMIKYRDRVRLVNSINALFRVCDDACPFGVCTDWVVRDRRISNLSIILSRSHAKLGSICRCGLWRIRHKRYATYSPTTPVHVPVDCMYQFLKGNFCFLLFEKR